MPIKQRLTGEAAKRADLHRKKRGRHPMLGLASKHLSVWQTIVQDGNPQGGITARQIQRLTHNYHPQILKDLCDAFLVIKVGRNTHNEVKYFGDDKGRGMNVQKVTALVELFEDESGNFFTRTTLEGGADNVTGRIVRQVAARRVHMRVPALEEGKHTDISEMEQPELGDVRTPAKFTVLDANDLRGEDTCIIDG